MIPNNSINFPIQIVSPNDILSVENNSFLNTVIYPNIEIKKYSTSAIDPQRNYLTAYEYPLNNHWVIWDYETGWVHLTGIWKASLTIDGSNVSPSHLKADIVKLLESTPKEYQQYIKRIRGGFLKIQGTWLPYKLCKILARRFCYYLRYSLIPIFGTDFPDSCLKPNEKGYGELKLDDLDSFEKETCLHQYHQYHLQLNKWCNSPNNNTTNSNKMIRQLLFLHFSKWALYYLCHRTMIIQLQQ